jgi:antibiotic biosynthesis monooxygenase (ABM) superfamily enzyme
MSAPSFLFFRTNSKTELNSSDLPPYTKRAFVAILVAIPMVFGLNMPLSSMATFVPVWGIIMINAIIIPSYMTFIIPKTSKLLSSWLSSSSTKTNGVN